MVVTEANHRQHVGVDKYLESPTRLLSKREHENARFELSEDSVTARSANVRLISVMMLVLLASTAHSLEWDAKKWLAHVGVGYSQPNDSAYNPAPIFQAGINLNVPVLVEQHLRAAGELQLNYHALQPETVAGQAGGNLFELSASFWVEHDVKVGQHYIWLGLAPSVSANLYSNHFQWQEQEGTLKPVEKDNPGLITGAAKARLVVPFGAALQVALQGQYSPLDGSYNGVAGQLSFQF